jgi:uncharacterized protein
VIDRHKNLDALREALQRSPVVLLVGPRQAGKSTLARLTGSASTTTFDLENPQHFERLRDPLLALEGLRGLVIIDEAQHAPALFPVLRVLADRPDRPATFLVLGSASPDLVGLGSESLAGRVEILELGGLLLADVGDSAIDGLWLRGALPASFSRSNTESMTWRRNYIDTFLGRDLAALGFRMPVAEMRRFWTMLAHYHGQTWNGSELGRALGHDQKTIRRYLDALTDALLVRQLLPWYPNVSKRVVRSPKVYIRDSGILHALLDLDTEERLLNHPKVGASWEGFVVEQIALALPDVPLYFWGTHAGAELDLLVQRGGRSIGIEIKRTSTPRVTPSIRHALVDLGLDEVLIMYPGADEFPLAENVRAVPVRQLVSGSGMFDRRATR